MTSGCEWKHCGPGERHNEHLITRSTCIQTINLTVRERGCAPTVARARRWHFLRELFWQIICPDMESNGTDTRWEIGWLGWLWAKVISAANEKRRATGGRASISSPLLSFVDSHHYQPTVTRKGQQAMTRWKMTLNTHTHTHTHTHTQRFSPK